jgi:hypothetical protein
MERPGGAETQRARLHKGDDDARAPANPEDRAEQRHREGCHEDDRQRDQEGPPAGARLLCPAAREMPGKAIYIP